MNEKLSPVELQILYANEAHTPKRFPDDGSDWDGLKPGSLRVIIKQIEILDRMEDEKGKLEKFLSELAEAQKHYNEHGGLKLSSMAGILEQGSLDEINRFLGIDKDGN